MNSTQKTIVGPNINEALEILIRASFVLKQKLNDEQIEKFIQKSFELPNAGKLELLTQLEQEQMELVNREDNVEEQLKALHDWKAFVDVKLEEEKKNILKESEKDEDKSDDGRKDELLKELEGL